MYCVKEVIGINTKYILRFILILILILSIIIGICFYKMHPTIMKYAVSVAETVMLNFANEAVVNVLAENNIAYNDIVSLSTNSEGYVTSLETNVYNINKFKSYISNEISKIIENKEDFDLEIPIGTFLGSDFTTGFGPKLRFKMKITTTAFVDFSHEFKGAGINQVLHIVNVNIKINGRLIVIGYNKGIKVSTSAIAAQTVIVGKTPDAFTNVLESETDNTGGLINDYGAIAE